MEADFPPYKDFLNFFKNAELVIENTDNAYFIDQLFKLVFMNIVVQSKKIVGYRLNEVFEEYEKLKISDGVTSGT